MDYDKENCNEKTPLDEQLKGLREELLEWQEKSQEAASEITEHEAQIQALGTFIGEFDQIVAVYEEAYPGLHARQGDYEKCCENEKNCLKNILGDECSEEVCKKVDEINEDISKREEKIKCDEDSLKTAQGEREGAAKKLDEAKVQFELCKTPIKSIESRFKSLDQLKKEIDKEHDEHNDTIAYYLLACADKFCSQVYGDLEVIDVDQFDKKLRCAWKDYMDADSYFNETDARVKTLEKMLEIKNAQLEADKKNLETTIRRKLIELANSDICSKPESDDSCET